MLIPTLGTLDSAQIRFAVPHLLVSCLLIPLYWPSASLRLLLLVAAPLGGRLARGQRAPLLRDQELPAVSIVVTTRNEPYELVVGLLRALGKLDYPRFEVVLADNSDLTDDSGEIEWETLRTLEFALSSDDEIRLVRRHRGEALGSVPGVDSGLDRLRIAGEIDGGKAGNINEAIRTASCEYEWVLILDADSAITSRALRELVSIAIREETRGNAVGFVQSCLGSSNPRASRLSRAQSVLDELYYRYFFRLKAAAGVVSNWGHGVVISRAAWQETSGFPLEISEDLAWGIKVLLGGKRKNVYALTETLEGKPATWDALKIQRARWATGTTMLMRSELAGIWRSTHLRLHEKLDLTYDLTSYFLTAVGCLLPALFLTSGVLGTARSVYFATLLPAFYLVMAMDNLLVPLEAILRGARGRALQGIRLIRAMPTISVYCGALAAQIFLAVCGALLQRDHRFEVTPKGIPMRPSEAILRKENLFGFGLAGVNGWIAIEAFSVVPQIVPLLLVSPICYVLAPLTLNSLEHGRYRSYRGGKA